MVKGLYTGYTGLLNEQNRMDILTNNLANASTTGFKKEGTTSQSFDAVLAYKIKDASEIPNIPRNIGINTPGVKIGENYTDYSQGSFRLTNNPYDVALGEEGFFAIEFTNKQGQVSTKYTRDGSFTLNKDGFMVTKDGDYVLGTNGRIKLDPNKESLIDKSGNIYQNDVLAAKMRVDDFADYNYLEHYGENMYQPVEGATLQASNATVFSGTLEASNVQTVSEMVQMITVTRAYETNQKIVQAHDSTLEIAANQLGKL